MCPGRDRELRKQHDLETARGGGQHLLQLHWTAMHIPFVSIKIDTRSIGAARNFGKSPEVEVGNLGNQNIFHFCLKKQKNKK